jgi:crotonobetainyl-CoA:carnitine CoA-transferase CaiB-like acyl-CoA transferase
MPSKSEGRSEPYAGSLRGLRVVELVQGVAGAYCGRQFAAWGADVVMLEPEGGSPLRTCAPLAPGASGERHSLLWTYVAANKRSLALETLGEDDLEQLLAKADVFITDLDVEALAAMGLSVTTLAQRFPHLCAVVIRPFGLDGPYARLQGGDLVVQALSGYLSLNGRMGAPPLRAPGHIVSFAVGVNAFVGALASRLKYLRSGWGDLVEVSEMETLANLVPYLRVQYYAAEKRREGGTEAGVRLLPCADGWISLLIVNPVHKDLWTEVLAIPPSDWPGDIYEGEYPQIVARLEAFLSRYTVRKSANALFLELAGRAITAGKVTSPKDLLSEPQLEARGFFRTYLHPDLGPLSFAGPPGLAGGSDMAPPGPAPRRGELRGAAALGWDSPRPPPALDATAETERPLHGLKVLDLTQAWIGPFAMLLLADLGADVIKVESHKRPDVWRQTSPNPVAITNVDAKQVNRSHYFNSVNRNKRDLTLDLTTADGKALFERLVKDADVVAENYTPRVMSKFGLDYAALSAINPRIVMTSSSGFGKTGPWSDFRTNGSAIEALAGWDYLHAYPGGDPVLMGFYQADAICGLQMAAMTLISLLRREAETGRGDSIDGAMLEASAGYVGDLILHADLLGDTAPIGNRDPGACPSGVFPCQGEDRWLALSIPDDAGWRAFLGAAGLPEQLRDPRFDTEALRRRYEDDLERLIGAWTAQRDADALMSELQALGVPAGVVRSLVEGLNDPQMVARDWFKTMSRPDLGAHKYNGFPWRFGRCVLEATLPPPRLGEHSEELLRERLGLSRAEIDRLKDKGVTGAVL